MSSPQEEFEQQDPNASAPANADASAAIEADLSGGNLDKIRSILFGAQSREFERRFSKLDESLARETADIRHEMRSRMDALEATMRRELEALGDRLKAEEHERTANVRDMTAQLKETNRSLSDKIKSEQSDRADALTELSGELQSTASAIDRRIGQLDDQTTKASRELRDQLAEQGRRASEDLRNKSEEIWAALSKAVQELRHEKTDRAALAALLTEVAMRLNDEFKLPSGE